MKYDLYRNSFKKENRYSSVIQSQQLEVDSSNGSDTCLIKQPSRVFNNASKPAGVSRIIPPTSTTQPMSTNQ